MMYGVKQLLCNEISACSYVAAQSLLAAKNLNLAGV